jgi:hypothetical protein
MHQAADLTSMALPRLVNGTKSVKNAEPDCQARKLDVEFKQFYGVEPSRVDRRFTLTLSEQSYLPKVIYSLLEEHDAAEIIGPSCSRSSRSITPGPTGP